MMRKFFIMLCSGLLALVVVCWVFLAGVGMVAFTSSSGGAQGTVQRVQIISSVYSYDPPSVVRIMDGGNVCYVAYKTQDIAISCLKY